MKASVGDVVQIDGGHPSLAFCFAIVTAVYPWGVVAFVTTPRGTGVQRIDVRIEEGYYARIGQAEWVTRRPL